MRGRAKTSILKTKDAQTTAPDPTPEQEGTCCLKLRLFEGHPEARSRLYRYRFLRSDTRWDDEHALKKWKEGHRWQRLTRFIRLFCTAPHLTFQEFWIQCF